MIIGTFTPSIDWGNEVVASLWWVVKAWIGSAAGLLVVGVLVARFTTWGRLSVLLMLVMVAVRISILLSYYSNDLYSALQVAFEGAASGNARVRDSGIHVFCVAIDIFAIISVIYIVRAMVDQYLMQQFIIRWRVWLTQRLMSDWLDDRAYYRGQFIDRPIDNPDQRIQQDIDAFTALSGGMMNVPSNGTAKTLLFGAVQSVVSVLSFAVILWNLSFSITVLGLHIPRALFWIVIVYVVVASVVAFGIGRPLIRLSFRNEKLNAIFRYALVRLRDAGEAVGFYRGERAERGELNVRSPTSPLHLRGPKNKVRTTAAPTDLSRGTWLGTGGLEGSRWRPSTGVMEARREWYSAAEGSEVVERLLEGIERVDL